MRENAEGGTQEAPAERGARVGSRRRWEEVIEIFDAVILAIIAVSTAWSGYQAARWDGHQAVLYGEATRYRFQADAASTLGGQELAADAAMLNSWMQAESAGKKDVAKFFVDRFTPDYRTAFEAWLKTDPLNNPSAPPGPGYMPGFQNPEMASATHLNALASQAFEEGTAARQTGDKYVRATVMFAAVLFMVGISQRFKIRAVRVASLSVTFLLLATALYSVVSLARM